MNTTIKLILFFLFSASLQAMPEQDAIPIKVVVLVNFEIGEVTGDTAGEFQYWMERGIDGQSPLSCTPLKYSTYDACLDYNNGVLVTFTGLTADKAAASVMALGLDNRFDFSKSYWLIGGIAGIDANNGTLGSAVWGRWIVNGDWAHEIDPREMPTDWDIGYFPFARSKPYEQPPQDTEGKVFELSSQLSKLAYSITKDTPLMNSEMAEEISQHYTNKPKALEQPSVMQGDNVSASTFWHGDILNQWANDWMTYWTIGQGEFVTSAVEDSGIMEAIRFLTQGGKADMSRVMLLRTASNFTTPPPGVDAATNLAREMSGFGAMGPAVENHWRVGSKMVREITFNWKDWKDRTWK